MTDQNFLSPGWAVVREGDETYFTQGSLRLPLYPDSLTRTVELIRELPLQTLTELARLNDLPVEPPPPDTLLAPVVAYLVQYAWYREVRGQVPAKVITNTERRLTGYRDLLARAQAEPSVLNTAASAAGPLPRQQKRPADSPRVATTYVLNEDPEVRAYLQGRLKGQQALVLQAFLGLNGSGPADALTAGVIASGVLRTQQPPDRVVAFYLHTWRQRGYLTYKGETVPAETQQVLQETARAWLSRHEKKSKEKKHHVPKKAKA